MHALATSTLSAHARLVRSHASARMDWSVADTSAIMRACPRQIAMDTLRYLTGYPPAVLDQVRELIAQDKLATVLARRYPDRHAIRTDRHLYEYVKAMKERYMRSSPTLHKATYDNHLHVVKHALGTHTAISRVHGGRLKASREIRIASVFRDAPEPFLQMIVAHELAHLKEADHNKAFYQLCNHITPDYHQLEFDLRLYLTQLALSGDR
ncbi:M48 family metallopeptidase [Xanthomonas euvesicatoria]|uniref:M48 family metallopeptidase n=2 Tax=Xanthomonas TaxID=338 RepID=UPI0002266439|nr:M48 family metallopeptidase [Xanthomonas euvesicatoria]AEO41620.1 metal-dependent hydrolase [Xanthomonas euvesicatoria pv. citrumelo F1]MCP3047212.1 M48 family metallopeptidase [Xanthomonas euvesicatoria pv. allii]PPU90776.1 M48 family peptidase [Xanthomonas euvesicatoria pv. citrumelonis]TKA18964.1 metal-dependent hydrolase [Xanthomonas euvesicatoria pv. citrumelonis]